MLAKDYDTEVNKVFSKHFQQQPESVAPPSQTVAAPVDQRNDDWVMRYDSHGDYKLNDRVLLTVADMEHLPVESKLGTLRWIGVAKRVSHLYMYGVEMVSWLRGKSLSMCVANGS